MVVCGYVRGRYGTECEDQFSRILYPLIILKAQYNPECVIQHQLVIRIVAASGIYITKQQEFCFFACSVDGEYQLVLVSILDAIANIVVGCGRWW